MQAPSLSNLAPRVASPRRRVGARRLAALVAGLTAAVNAATLGVFFGTGFLGLFGGPGTTGAELAIVNLFVVEVAAVTMAYALTGLVLAGRAGATRIAAVLLAGGVLLALSPFGYVVGGTLVYHDPLGPAANAMLLLGPLTIGPAYALILPVLALTFPTGSLPSGRWRLPAAVLAAAMAAGTLIELFAPGPVTPEPNGSRNPFGMAGLPASVSSIGYPLVVAGVAGFMALGVAAVLVRYRGGGPTLRQQLRWFVAAVLLTAVPLVAAIAPAEGPPLWVLVAGVGLALVPVSVGIAVTRYRLYDIDVIVNRALVYGVLGMLVAAAYVVLATVLGRLAQGSGTPAGATAATVLAALVALAARQSVQQAIDRLLYGRRGDPLAVMRRVGRRLESAGTPEGLLAGVVAELRDALRVDAVAVYAADGTLLAGEGRPGSCPTLALAHGGESVGELRVWTGRGDDLGARDLRLLRENLGPQLAVAVEAVRLKRDLERANERLVAALEDERHRIRHDLHDGLGPTLTAIALRADAATNLLARDPDRARALLDVIHE